MKSSLISFTRLALLAAFGCSGCQLFVGGGLTPRLPDVIYVPTPQEMVDRMLQMAAVKPGETVYDLGCGDGRFVVTAARDFGARGIGVDIDPQRIAESRQNVSQAGVQDRVEIRQADLFTMDFADADVVALYLLPALNLRLRPRILDELRPGTRIVSNSFDMDDWKADLEEEHPETGQLMYFWIVPAKVQGLWDAAMPNDNQALLVLRQEFQAITGSIRLNGVRTLLRNPSLRGTTLSFGFDQGNERYFAVAEVTGNRLTGTVRREGAEETKPWSAQLSLQPGRNEN